MKSWKECKYYQEMYDLKHTWDHLLPCNPNNVVNSSDFDHKNCQLLKGVESGEMQNPYQLKTVVKYYIEICKQIENHDCGRSWCLGQDVDCGEGLKLLEEKDRAFGKMKELING